MSKQLLEDIDIGAYVGVPLPSTTSFLELNNEFSQQGSRISILSTFHADAKYRVDLLEQAIEKHKAELAERIRKKSKEKITEGALNRKCWQDHTFCELNSRMLKAKRQASMIQGYVNAMNHKKDALVTISANLRREWSGDPDDSSESRQEKFERALRKKRK